MKILSQNDQGVIDSRRISIKWYGQTIETHIYVLTFNRLQLSKIINVGCQTVRVDKYVEIEFQVRSWEKD